MTARKVRKEFAAKKKAGVDFGKVFLTNSVSLATRVRVDILKAIARMNSSEKEDFYVASYASQPIIHVKQKGNEGRSTALTFSDAIAKYGGSLREEDLGEAYRRTGNAFRGQLQQVFVVLQDSVMGVRAGGYGHSAWAPRAAQMKRVREGESTGSVKNFETPKKQVKRVLLDFLEILKTLKKI